MKQVISFVIATVIFVGIIFYSFVWNRKSKFTEIKKRNSIKIILINPKNEILLMSADDPKTRSKDGSYFGRFWFMIGGKIEDGENIKTAALREIWEETGIAASQIEFGPIVWFGEFEMILSGKPTRLSQQFIVAKTSQENISLDNLTEEEKSTIDKLRWFSLDEISNCDEVIYPVGLADYLEPILAGKVPLDPVWIDLAKKPSKK